MCRVAIPLLGSLLMLLSAVAIHAGVIVPPQRAVSDDEVRLTLARELARRNGPGDATEARGILNGILEADPDNAAVLEAMVDMEAAAGHYAAARQFLLRVEQASPGDEALVLRNADRMLLWGETSKAVRRWREARSRRPDDPAVLLGLARALRAAQRLHEAEAMALLAQKAARTDARRSDAMAFLAMVRLNARQSLGALEAAQALADLSQDDPGALSLCGRALLQAGRAAEALDAFQAAGDMIGAARAAKEMGDHVRALEFADLALAHDPAAPEARLLVAEGDADLARSVASQAIAVAGDPALLNGWGEALAAQGMFSVAAEAYRRALAIDPDHFPARLGLARVLASAGKYEAALAQLGVLAGEMPESDVVLLEQSRVLAWDRRFDEAIESYARLSARDSANPIPRREAARTAYWAKEADKGDHLYAAILEHLEPTAGIEAEAAALERQAKREAFEGRFIRAMDRLNALKNVEPGNEEGLFGLAQAQCVLGLGDLERGTYRRLLDADPLHFLAVEALERRETRSAPAVSGGWTLWNEEGRGDLADITRQRWDLVVEVPVRDRHLLRLTQHRWDEAPGGFAARQATGQTIEGRARVNEYLALAASLTRKDYFDSDTADTRSGRLEAQVNVDDVVRLGLRLSRQDELANGFALGRGVQSDHLRLEAAASPVRRLELDAGAEVVGYNDDNSGRAADAAVGWAFTDHPRTLKLVASGQVRDTVEMSSYHYSGRNLTDIIHPYWTPSNYLAGALTLVWNHDLSKRFFCGAERNIYELRASVGTDSEHNPSGTLAASWLWEFGDRWSVRTEVMVHESEQWDAQAASITLGRRF